MKLHRIIALCVVLFSQAALMAVAQPGRAPSAQLEAIQKLSWLTGKWEGKGWMEFVSNQRHEFTSTEKIEFKVDGVALSIEGFHRGGDGRVVHNALAIVSYDETSKLYRFRAWLSDGRYTDAEGKLLNGAFQWSLQTPRGRMRYTIKLNEKGEWFEIGEMSNDGQDWRKFFEMVLRKVS